MVGAEPVVKCSECHPPSQLRYDHNGRKTFTKTVTVRNDHRNHQTVIVPGTGSSYAQT